MFFRDNFKKFLFLFLFALCCTQSTHLLCIEEEIIIKEQSSSDQEDNFHEEFECDESITSDKDSDFWASSSEEEIGLPFKRLRQDQATNLAESIEIEKIENSEEDVIIQDEFVYIFATALGGTRNAVKCYTKTHKINMPGKKKYIIDNEKHKVYSVVFPSESLKSRNASNKLCQKPNYMQKIFWNNLCIGQEQDIEAIERKYNRAVREKPKAKIIMVGVCSGATAILNFLGTRKPKNVVAAILESPVYNIKDAIKGSLRCSFKHYIKTNLPLIEKLLRNIFYELSIFEKHGIHPSKILQNIDPNIKILLLGLRDDKLTPFESTCKIYADLKALEHKHVYIKELLHGRHGGLLWTANIDRSAHQDTTHKFFEHYDFPHNKHFSLRSDSIQELDNHGKMLIQELIAQ